MRGPCLCGDAECPYCGTAQGTRTPDEPEEFESDEPGLPRCWHPGGHVWNRTAAEADEARISGDYANDNIRCVYCGADGDA